MGKERPSDDFGSVWRNMFLYSRIVAFPDALSSSGLWDILRPLCRMNIWSGALSPSLFTAQPTAPTTLLRSLACPNCFGKQQNVGSRHDTPRRGKIRRWPLSAFAARRRVTTTRLSRQMRLFACPSKPRGICTPTRNGFGSCV